ncbi:signal peptidase I [Plectosphaerella cucumerina]|uniref:Signal peptidase complex catalytic subunit SEC11 n=1 Tax=Plectosphaerella cucumerina TaxID=40658 RepID=A0A8K0X163_9PEZI|nr:signal peptidase I [Plectosphaerella cucumerina]
MRGSLVSALPGFQVASALYMAWCLARLAVNTPYPAMVVLTESMVPAFHPGDVIFLWNRTELIQIGDIPVIWFEADPLPMVHRALSIAHGEEGHQLIRTKGDNNDVDDVSLYPPGQKFVYRRQIIGLVRGYLPFVGLFTIHVGKVQWLREIILMGLLASIMLGKGKARPAGIRAHRSEH